MTNLNFEPLSANEAAILGNVDELVEMGIPRDMADRATRAAIQALDDTVNPILDRFNNQFPSLNERALVKSLFLGGLHNYTTSRARLIQTALLVVIAHYKGD